MNGTILSRASYPNLWNHALSSGNLADSESEKDYGQFGPGDGSSTFSLPDLRGVVIRAWDEGRGLDPGRALGTFQADAVLRHDHSTSEVEHSHDVNDPKHSHSYSQAFGESAQFRQGTGSTILGIVSITPQITNSGRSETAIQLNPAATGIKVLESGGQENLVKNVALLACIKF